MLQYRGTIAIRPGDTDHIFFAYPVPHKACKGISMNKYTAYMAKVQFLVAIWHSGSNDNAFGKIRPVMRIVDYFCPKMITLSILFLSPYICNEL